MPIGRYLILTVLACLAAGLALPARQPDEAQKKVLERFAGEFVELTPGKGKFPASFEMGSSSPTAPDTEKPVVAVTFKRPFSIAKYEVTQELYKTVMGTNPSRWVGLRNSVEEVTWPQAVSFCTKVTVLLSTQKLIGADEVIRLPSEAEWEYACRAGTKTAYSFGDQMADLAAYGWYNGNSKGEDPPVGKKKPNPWGLYDMHGYVWEWCSDAWSPTHKGAPTDGSPRTHPDEKDRVIRGGSWADPADKARSAYRDHKSATHKSDRIGFRCVRVVRNKERGK